MGNRVSKKRRKNKTFRTPSDNDLKKLVFGDLVRSCAEDRPHTPTTSTRRVLEMRMTDEPKYALQLIEAAPKHDDQAVRVTKIMAVIHYLQGSNGGTPRALVIEAVKRQVHNLVCEQVKDRKDRKVDLTELLSQKTLFRENTIEGRLFGCYAKTVGLRYLHYIFKVPVQAIVQRSHELQQQPSVCTEEFDNDEGSYSCPTIKDTAATWLSIGQLDDELWSMPDIDGEIKLREIKTTVQRFLSQITKNWDKVPYELRTLLKGIDVCLKNDGLGRAIRRGYLNAFFFLRFIVPSLIFPNRYGIVSVELNEFAQRQLMVVARIIQTIAVGQVVFKSEEDIMYKLSRFIGRNHAYIDEFYTNLLSEGQYKTYDPLPTVSPIVYENIICDIKQWEKEMEPTM